MRARPLLVTALRRRAAAAQSDLRAELLRASHESTIDGVLVVSPDGRVVTTNSRFAALWRLPPEVIESGSDDAALAYAAEQVLDPVGFLARVRELYATRTAARDEVRLRDGRVFDRYGTPLVGAAGVDLGYAVYFRDVSVERHAAAALEASEARYRSLVQALANEVWHCTPDGRLLADLPRWREVTGQSEQELRDGGWLNAVHPDDRARVAEAWRCAVETGAAYHVEYRIAPIGAAPAELAARSRVIEVRGVPLERDGTVGGWVGVYSDVTELRRAEEAKERLAALVAAAAERTRALQRVTAALSSTVTTADVMAVILAQGETELRASASGIALRDGDAIHYHVLKGYPAAVQARWQTFDVAVASPVPHVLRTGQPLFLGSRREILARFPVLREFLDVSGEQAMARLPLTTPSGTFGVLSLGFPTERSFPVEEREFLVALAGQCAQALERTQLYERVRDTALLLQSSLLPESLPATPGVRLAARYQPATADVEVGGDWYDALRLPDGRLALAVGDVLGKGVRAASVMGQVRNALRGLVHADPAPGLVLDRLDSLVRAHATDEEFVTLVYALLDPRTGALTWASAGHPPPLVVGEPSAGGAWLADDAASVPLGLGPDERREASLTLAPGQTLLLFSDGLVESRHRPLVDGLPLLAVEAARLARADSPPDKLCDGLIAALAGGRQEDDVTLLLARLVPDTAARP